MPQTNQSLVRKAGAGAGPSPRRTSARRSPAASSASRNPTRKSSARKSTKALAPSGSASAKKRTSLTKMLSPENIQETMKNVGNLRNSVKNWLRYLQQADQVLDTVFVTTNSLKETGVLDKLVKQRGKNLSTEDFTNILVALMNSPAGNQILRSMGNGENKSAETTST